ncbi:MAG TPA: phosphoribosylanthranilate isomerase [Bryobacteraceae bacterium]|nr:phosphoribosylanthranilate isomerase [Bryobacteraceae bacterium]
MSRASDLPFIIKVCGITNEEDAHTAIEAGANALGFNFYEKSPRYVTVSHARKIIEAVPGDYLKVGIFVNPALEEITAASLDIVQLYGEWQAEFEGLTVWKAITPNETERFCGAEAYLMDAPSSAFGGSGKMFNWMLARGRHGVIIAGGLDASNVAEAIATAKPWGVDACSRLESRPGKKEARKVQDFVSAAREAFRIYVQEEVLL